MASEDVAPVLDGQRAGLEQRLRQLFGEKGHAVGLLDDMREQPVG